jgi:tetratricopeptide (TPR) repeat protein
LYAHDLSLKGYHQRLGHLSRLTGDLDVALHHYDAALKLDPEDVSLKNTTLETLMMGIKLSEACDFGESFDLAILPEHKVTPDHLDLIISQAEILLYQDECDRAADLINTYSQAGDAYPRYQAIQSRIAARAGKPDIASEHLKHAIELFQQKFGQQQPLALSATFRKMITLHSMSEACLDLGEYSQALQIHQQIYDQCGLQPLFNWRYLYTLVKSAETQQIARALHITAHSPGEACLSEDHHRLAEEFLAGLQTTLSQEQIVCLKARIESAFTGRWPSQLNISACLHSPDEAAAVLMGCQDEHLVQEILAAYYDEIDVLHAYGIYALRHHQVDAVPHIEHALGLDIANPISHALLAYLNSDQPEQALKSIKTALGFWPDESGWHAFAADLNVQLGRTAQAEEHIQLALEKQPENADYWKQSAMLNAQKDDLLQARADLEKSTAYRPDDPVAWVKMAEINSRMGETDAAIQNIRKASQLNPEDQSLAEQELQYLFEQNNYTELETKAEQILSKDGSNERARILLGRALAKQGKFDQALRTLNGSASKHTRNPAIALECLKIKKDQQGNENVLPELVNLAQDFPEDAPILTTLIDWLIQSNRLEEAEQVAQTTVRVIPDQAEVYLMLGRLQRAQGKLDQATAHLSQAITLDPTFVEAYIELGKTFQERRELDKAIETFEKGSQANHTDPRPYYYAGLALKDCKDYQGAEFMLKQAKRWSPDDANIIRQLGVVTALNLINHLREVQ